MHRLFTELEPSITVTEQNLADRVRYILRSNIFDGAELERLRREAVPSSNEIATTEDAVPQVAEQRAHVDARCCARNRANEEYIGRGDCGNAQYASRKSTATSPHSPKQAESGSREGSEANVGDLFGSQPGPLRDELNSFWRRAGSLPYYRRQGFSTGQSSAIPAWRRRIEKRIAKARALIGRLICFRSGNNRQRIVRTVRMVFAGTNVSLSQPDIPQKLTEHIDDLKQRIAA
ncbi:unnamed protein product [Parnassius apollo]|uniref:(apollo) hypothetical protein n=1 Tax=Parnassius apollo TaxID=110799 RepID=A0A8S3X2M7_PARAO|nr:unnamed protein product [Parnassius apollo]